MATVPVKKKISIVVLGESGVGISALISNLFDINYVVPSLYPMNMKPSAKTIIRNGIEFEVFSLLIRSFGESS